jgi:hypothetical protein
MRGSDITVSGLFCFSVNKTGSYIMSIQAHSAEQMIRAGVGGAFQFGSDQGLFVAGDLTSLAAAKAAVAVALAKKHVAEQTFGVRVTSGFDQADNYVANAMEGSSITNVTSVITTRGHYLRF